MYTNIEENITLIKDQEKDTVQVLKERQSVCAVIFICYLTGTNKGPFKPSQSTICSLSLSFNLPPFYFIICDLQIGLFYTYKLAKGD